VQVVGFESLACGFARPGSAHLALGSGKHLHRYLREFEYRFNRRHDDDVFIQTVRRLCRVEQLRFNDLTAGEKA